MNFFDKLQALDRRWIYALLALAIIIPLSVPFNSDTLTTKPVEDMYQLVDSYAGRSDRAVLISFNHDASTMAELYPMEIALLRHCFERNIKVFTICFTPTAAPLIDFAINKVKEEYPNIQSGVDYCNIGYKPAGLYLPIVLGMGDDIAKAVETDAEGRRLSSLKIMTDIKNYNELNLIFETSGATAAASWITYARGKFGANVASGVTAVIAADAYPMLQTGQLIGLLGGLKGASEYEKLVDVFAAYEDENNPNGRKFSKEIVEQTLKDKTFKISDQEQYKFKNARIGMNAQIVAHVLIILFIILGNVGYFLSNGRKNQ